MEKVEKKLELKTMNKQFSPEDGKIGENSLIVISVHILDF